MSTCGYLCPQCEGKGLMEDGSECDWCIPKTTPKETKALNEKDLNEWIEKVHQGPCCSDVEVKNEP